MLGLSIGCGVWYAWWLGAYRRSGEPGGGGQFKEVAFQLHTKEGGQEGKPSG